MLDELLPIMLSEFPPADMSFMEPSVGAMALTSVIEVFSVTLVFSVLPQAETASAAAAIMATAEIFLAVFIMVDSLGDLDRAWLPVPKSEPSLAD